MRAMGTHHANIGPLGSEHARSFFQSSGYAPSPLLVQWLISTSCSLSCPHCSAADPVPRHASFELVHRLLDQVSILGVPQLLLTGGEPLEHPRFPDVVAEMRERGIAWSLNTAVLPNTPAQRAIERHPPQFVAVSVDGPREIHDPFRGRPGAFDEALRAIAWYASCGVKQVAVGTTVTSINFAHLDELFVTVLESGATSWGLHLVVPEGRASRSREIMLTSAQTRALVRFVARRRSTFPVNMADEIGFCGDWEPLVRDTPFFCGAGRTQCVVLPDGEVVPCTTLDRSASVGNVMTEPLSTLWKLGFGALRAWRPRGACRKCRHAAACSGGCWLQRRHGHHCHRAAWERGNLPIAALCAGLAACTSGTPTATQATPSTAPVPVEAHTPASAEPTAPTSPPLGSSSPSASSASAYREEMILGLRRPASMDIVDWVWIQHTIESPDTLCSTNAASTFQLANASLDSDSLAAYFEALSQPTCAHALTDRLTAIRGALGTSRRSMNLIATIWRDLQEWALAESPAETRSPEERTALRAQLAELGRTAEAWRAVVFAKKLDYFLTPDRAWGHAMRSKAGPPPGLSFLVELGEKRWGPSEARARLTKRTLDQHPVGQSLAVPISCTPAQSVSILSPHGERQSRASDELGIFDVLRVPPTANAPVALTIRLGDRELTVSVAPGIELTYLDVAKLAMQSNRSTMQAASSRAEAPDAFFIPLLREQVLREGSAPRSGARRRLAAAWLF